MNDQSARRLGVTGMPGGRSGVNYFLYYSAHFTLKRD